MIPESVLPGKWRIGDSEKTGVLLSQWFRMTGKLFDRPWNIIYFTDSRLEITFEIYSHYLK